ncbi:MAG: transcription elongation factor Spt5 [Halobacteriota archaeon]|nr:transcription elongation factor Spt5 [Halobacteriota archaeon]
MSEETDEDVTVVCAVKTTANQERAVANMLEQVVRKSKFDIRSILVPDELKGYVLVEAVLPEIVEQAIQGVHHAKAIVKGRSPDSHILTIEEVEHFLTPKPAVTGISEGDIVELISGPFKGEKARVKRVDKTHEEITVELFDAMVPIPVTVGGGNVRILDKEESEE